MVRALEVLRLQGVVELRCDAMSPVQLLWIQRRLGHLSGLLHLTDLAGLLLLLFLGHEQEERARRLALRAVRRARGHGLHRLLCEDTALVPPADVLGGYGALPAGQEALGVVLQGLLRLLNGPLRGQTVQGVVLSVLFTVEVPFLGDPGLLFALCELSEGPRPEGVDVCAPALRQHRDAQAPLVDLRRVPEALLGNQRVCLLAPNLRQPLRGVRHGGEALHDRRRALALEHAPAALGALELVGAHPVEWSSVCADEPPEALPAALA
mmetsp:Transcript_50318/g.145937  ORF Transcript_50318/g.145937 Transcript_50318/m.145937 type:complete len:266 (+) Transcript_50318:480-1277(+)